MCTAGKFQRILLHVVRTSSEKSAMIAKSWAFKRMDCNDKDVKYVMERECTLYSTDLREWIVNELREWIVMIRM